MLKRKLHFLEGSHPGKMLSGFFRKAVQDCVTWKGFICFLLSSCCNFCPSSPQAHVPCFCPVSAKDSERQDRIGQDILVTLPLMWRIERYNVAIQPSLDPKRTSAILTHFGAGSSECEAGSVVCGLLRYERIEQILPCSPEATSELRLQPNLFFLPSQGSTK